MPDIKNILAMYMQATPVDRQEGTVWYNNAHDICKEISDFYMLPLLSLIHI